MIRGVLNKLAQFLVQEVPHVTTRRGQVAGASPRLAGKSVLAFLRSAMESRMMPHSPLQRSKTQEREDRRGLHAKWRAERLAKIKDHKIPGVSVS